MKLITETDIIDISKYRKERSLKQAFDDKQRIKSYDDEAAMQEIAQIEEEINHMADKVKIPGFPQLFSISWWLTGEKNSAHLSPAMMAREYSEQDKSKLAMIAHYAPGLIKKLENERAKVHNFLDRYAHAEGEAIQAANALDHALTSEIQMLKEVIAASR